MPRSTIAGAVHTQYRFSIAPGVTVRVGHLYGFDSAGRLVEVANAEDGRRLVYAMQPAVGNTAGTSKARCAVSVIIVIPRGALTASDRGKSVFAVGGQDVVTTDNGKRCGVLLDVDGPSASILLG